MKLRARFQDEDFELGEVVDADVATTPDGFIKFQAEARAGGRHTIFYDTLERFCGDWEDVPEEPKEYWFIDCDGEIEQDDDTGTAFDKCCKEIGNYFEAEEEAKRAVNKLKAWKRLKDKGFRFTSWDVKFVKDELCEGEFVMFSKCPDDMEKADLAGLDLLFGGEE